MERAHARRRATGPQAQAAVGDRATIPDPIARLHATVGNRALVRALRQPVVQRDGDDRSVDAATVRGHARAGIRGAGGRLPFLAEIQRAFGRHDVTGVRAHTGEHAGASARGMRARAYAFGEDVAFDGAPDVRTAAHEAAHVVQQRAGVTTPDGVGRPGDRHEQQADRVADLVADGRSAEAALGPPVAAGSPAPAVQRALSEAELDEAGNSLRAPDTLNRDAKFTTLKKLPADSNGPQWKTYVNNSRDLTAGTKVRITAQTDQRTTIRIFEWNSDAGGWDQIEGWVPTDAVSLGSTQQTELEFNDMIIPQQDDQISHEDVFQAGLSDCYFQAALAALAHTRPADIRDIIEDTGSAVLVQLYVSENDTPVRKTIILKRSLFMDDKGVPIYHGKKGSPLWPAFISKAWAVLKGDYADTQMGKAGDAMFALTGQESTNTNIKPLETGKLGVLEPSEAFATYERIRDNLVNNKPVALGTGSFAKSGLKATLNSWKPRANADHPDLPSGNVRNLHTYAVIDIQPRDLRSSSFKHWVPSIDVTLRDPRDADGATFTRKLRDILVAGKFSTFSYEE